MKTAILGSKTDKSVLENLTNVKSFLESKEIKVDFSYFKKSNSGKSSTKTNSYQAFQKMIKKSDFLIIDISSSSNELGFLISFALNEKKPVLVLNQNGKNKDSLEVFKTINNSKLLTIIEYTNKDLTKLIAKYLKEVKTNLDTKFILIISPEIEKYLVWCAENKRLHKAQVVREAVEKLMQKDKSYLEFLKQ